jgi:hypothetical protein
MRVIRKQINKRIINMKKLLIGMILILPISSQAINITINQTTCSNANGYTFAVCTQLTGEVQKLVDSDLPDVSIGDYGTGLANANSFAFKGLDSDYSDKFTYFMVRGGVGAAIEGEMDKPEKASGVGVGAAVTAGINLDILPVDKIGPVDLSKMDLMVSIMSYDLDQDNKDTNIKGEIGHFSVMARYQIMEGKDIFPGHMLEWGGLFLHTGFHRQSFDASLTSQFKDQQVDVGGVDATFGDSSAVFKLKTSTNTIPFEVSTYLRTIWALTFFGGAGFDIVSGSTDVDLSASGTVSGGTNDYAANIVAAESDSGDADATNFRAFGGLQFNLPFFRVTTHVNKGLGNDLIGVNAAIKILW